MGTFSSETVANRHNSGKFDTLNVLQNDLLWLLLHSWFSKFFGGGPPSPPSPIQEVHMEKKHIFSNHSSAPRQKLCYNDTNHRDYLLSVCDCQILKTMIL